MGWPGEVHENSARATTVPHWLTVEGNAIAQVFGMEKFELINDFVAAGHGIL